MDKEDDELMGNRVNRMKLIENREFLEAENKKQPGWMEQIGLNPDQTMLNRKSYGGKANFKNLGLMNKYSESPPESPAINDDDEQDLWM